FQDLILAYNEFKNAAFDLMSECSADMTRFPKHLMLGEAIPLPATLCQNSEYRHYFVQPPIYNLQKLLIQRTVSLHNRMVLMLESFDIKRINTINVVELKAFPIRITPSLEKTTPLSLRSIPWYYDLKKKSSYAALGTLKKYWSFDISRKCTDEKEGLILNYEDQLADQSVAKYKLGTPLYYDIQDYSFLRIEGQTGVDVNLAIKRLKGLKTQFDLAFDLISLQLDPNLGAVSIDYKCGFEDIQEEYQMLKLSFCRFATDIRELHKFINENQETLFDEDNENSEDIKKYLEKLNVIVEQIEAVCKSLSTCINNFDFPGFQEKYKSVLEQIIDFVLIDLELLQKINIGKEDAKEQIPLINGIIQRLSPLANKFIDLLFYNRFLRLYYSFKRREFYLKKQIDTFSTYISKNPGIDHQAGVPKGGTFILVYINDAKNTVIADFNLPYLCCSKTSCIPMCDDAGGFIFEMKPFARPDYAVTLVDNPVEIDVLRNDSQIFGAELSVKSDEVSQFGGTIKQNSEIGPLEYTPKQGFTGTDTFSYTLVDNKTGSSDMGKVTVVVKSPEQKGCYTVEILQCWGDKSVRATLNVRDINVPEGANIFELLLESLRKTGGFTEDEIFSNVLEEPERRRALLNCLGIANNDNTTYEELGQLIFDYQKSNCGVVQPEKQCYTIEILQCWGDEAVKDVLTQREISVPTGSNMFEAVLSDLRKTRGFTTSEIRFNVLESEERRRRLLGCIGIQVGPNTTYQEMEQLILDYQNSNCGVVQPATECYSVEILSCWGDEAVKQTIERRQLSIPAGGNMFEVLLADLRRTRGFTDAEIRTNVLESPDRRRNLLKCLGISVDETTPYEQLGQLIINYQLQNCGAAVARPSATVELGLLPASELVKVLESRGKTVASTESRETLEAEIASSGGNVLNETELMAVSRDSLTKILNNRNITHTTSENKTQLIKKLLG
ncbi:MAG TPA: Ig-like domain-containing protein, partial [Draconibacterium sp.]|nr:Ig-like domain-containing protein [Draconibacterium sp.]